MIPEPHVAEPLQKTIITLRENIDQSWDGEDESLTYDIVFQDCQFDRGTGEHFDTHYDGAYVAIAPFWAQRKPADARTQANTRTYLQKFGATGKFQSCSGAIRR